WRSPAGNGPVSSSANPCPRRPPPTAPEAGPAEAPAGSGRGEDEDRDVAVGLLAVIGVGREGLHGTVPPAGPLVALHLTGADHGRGRGRARGLGLIGVRGFLVVPGGLFMSLEGWGCGVSCG